MKGEALIASRKQDGLTYYYLADSPVYIALEAGTASLAPATTAPAAPDTVAPETVAPEPTVPVFGMASSVVESTPADTQPIAKLRRKSMIQREQDPEGKSCHEPGAKLDAGKTRLGLVLLGFSHALEEVGKVGTYGAKKYTDNGWLQVPDGFNRYTDAMLRHILKEAGNELTDPDTELLHAAHAAWNALARLELIIRASAK